MNAVIETILGNTQQIGCKKVANIPTELLTVDKSYQRPIAGKVGALVANWNNNRMDLLKVSVRDDKFFVINGQNRCEAARRLGIKSLPCEILQDLDIKEEAKIFGEQDTLKTKVSAIDAYKAQVVAEDPVAMAVCEVCDKFDIKIARYKDRAKSIKSIASLKKIVQTCGADSLEWLFTFIEECGQSMNPDAYMRDYIMTINLIWRYNRNQEEEMKIIRKYISEHSDIRGWRALANFKYSQKSSLNMYQIMLDELELPSRLI